MALLVLSVIRFLLVLTMAAISLLLVIGMKMDRQYYSLLSLQDTFRSNLAVFQQCSQYKSKCRIYRIMEWCGCGFSQLKVNALRLAGKLFTKNYNLKSFSLTFHAHEERQACKYPCE